MKNNVILFILFAFAACGIAQAQSDNSVEVVYNGTSATVNVADNISQYLIVTQQGAHVSIAQSDSVASEITYTLSGTSTDGEFYMSGSYKATIELNGLTLTNATPVYSGAAVHIQNGKRINVKVITGTTNTLVDAASGSQKGCLYVKGHAEFKQQGTLNVVGNVKHAIKAGEYISLKNATLNITSAVGDGISCNQYFLMQSGTVNISGTGDDGIQCDLEGDTATAITEDHEDEDSGNIYIEGGNITINCAAIAAKGIKAAGDIFISGDPVIDITTSGKGEWDEDDQETSAACGISADGDIDISGGTLTLTSTGNTDHISSDYYSSPKGIKAGVKTEVGNSYTYGGGMVISGGKVKVTTSGRNAEGIESKNYLNISGGEIFINAYDDGINSAQDMTITGGYIYSHSNNNDGIDANGNIYLNGGLVYAIGSRSPELGIDANSEEGKKVFVNGGVIIAVGGIENGASMSQATYRSSSVSGNTWYGLSYGDEVIAFYVPQVTTGGGHGPGGGGNSSGLVISVPSTPTLKSGVTATGTGIFENNCYLDATVSGGTSVSLTHIGGTVGIDDVVMEQIVNDPRVFSIDGRYLGTEVPATFRGVYIQNGKKHIKLQ